MCRTDCVRDIKEDFLRTQKKSEKVSLRKNRRFNMNLLAQLHRSVLRLFAPLM